MGYEIGAVVAWADQSPHDEAKAGVLLDEAAQGLLLWRLHRPDPAPEEEAVVEVLSTVVAGLAAAYESLLRQVRAVQGEVAGIAAPLDDLEPADYETLDAGLEALARIGHDLRPGMCPDCQVCHEAEAEEWWNAEEGWH